MSEQYTYEYTYAFVCDMWIIFVVNDFKEALLFTNIHFFIIIITNLYDKAIDVMIHTLYIHNGYYLIAWKFRVIEINITCYISAHIYISIYIHTFKSALRVHFQGVNSSITDSCRINLISSKYCCAYINLYIYIYLLLTIFSTTRANGANSVLFV